MNILFVDDDAMNRRVVKDMLGVVGASMDEADSAEAGLALIEGHDYQVILMDLRMPGMDGLDATKETVQLHSESVERFIHDCVLP